MRRIVTVLLIITALAGSQPSQELEGKRCIVCNMDVNMSPELTSQVKMKDGTYKYAESPKHILQYYFKNKEKIAELWVKDYKTGKWIDGTKAYYVVIEEGPMGKDLAPFKSRLKAKKFAKGKRVYKFSELSLEFIKHLDIKNHKHMEHGPKGHK